MKKTNPYLQQLNTAIDTTRNELLGELNQAESARTTALSARDYAASDKWAAYKEMGLNEQVLTVASRIEEMAALTQLHARNLTLFANESQADAAQAQADMAEAATAIKNAAGAMELLTRGVHDSASVTKSKDAGNLINKEALAASKAVELCVTAVNHLQTQSLESSIIAAKPMAGSVAQSFSVLGDQVVSLVTDTTLARDMARQEVAATTANRNRTWSRYFTQIPPFERQLQAHNGLLQSFAEIDKLANYGLKVSVANYKPAAENDPPAKVHGKKTSGDSKPHQELVAQRDQTGLCPGILAEVVVPKDASGRYLWPVFYAVKELNAATFNFSSTSKEVLADGTPGAWAETKHASKEAKKAHDEAASAPVPALGGAFTAHIQHDDNNEPIKFGETYRIFMKQELHLKQDLKSQQEHEDGSRGVSVMDCPRYSLASQPVMANFTFEKHLTAPKFVRLPCVDSDGPDDPLLLAFTLPAAPAENVSYRAIIVPSKLWNAHLEDEQFLIEHANPAVYIKLDFDLHSHSIDSITHQITDRFAADLKVLLPAGDPKSAKKAAQQASQTVRTELEKLSADDLSRTALVYYSSVNSTTQKSNVSLSVAGDYLDMYGSLINLSNDSYRIGVLAWLDDPDSPTATACVSALVAASAPIGVHTPHYEGSGHEEPVSATPASATAA